MGAHTTSDDPSKYRSEAEVEIWKHKDPIKRMRGFMEEKGHGDQAFFDAVDAEADEVAARVRAACQQMADPDPGTMFDDVYVDPHPLVAAQREDFLAYQAGFESEAS